MPEIKAPDDINQVEVRVEDTKEDEPYKKELAKMSFHEKRWFYGVRVGSLIFVCAATFVVVSIYVAHLVLPTGCRWLDAQDMSSLKDLSISITVGLLMSATTTYFFRGGRGR